MFHWWGGVQLRGRGGGLQGRRRCVAGVPQVCCSSWGAGASGFAFSSKSAAENMSRIHFWCAKIDHGGAALEALTFF